MEITRNLVKQVIKKIVDNTHPDMIVLFGSFAEKKQTPDSDLDLLIVRKSNLIPRERTLEIYRLFADRQFPLDIIVYTPEEVEKYKNLEGSFIKNVLEHGKILYERAA